MFFPDNITFWNEKHQDGFGSKAWTLPTTIASRNSNVTNTIRNKDGLLLDSNAVAYAISDELQIGSAVVFGISLSPIPPARASRVISISDTPSGFPGLKKIWL